MPVMRTFAAVLMNYAFDELAPDDQPIYSIGAVERMVDIPAATIRNWEQRYGLIAPERSQGGHRLYARRQVEQLRFVKRELDAGLQPAEAHRLLADTIAAGQPLGRDDRAEGPRVLILLAERDPYAAEFAEFFLRTEGYEVVLALDAAEAERTSVERRPDLAVVEVHDLGRDRCRALPAAQGAGRGLLPGHLLAAGAGRRHGGRRGCVPR